MRDDQLHGWNRHDAERMGMPHWGAHYAKAIDEDTPRPYKEDGHALDDGAMCPICGRPATEVHHVVQKGLGGGGRVFVLFTDRGRFVMRSALFGLCSKCHREFTEKRADAWWEWHDADYEQRWESGDLLAHGFPPHSPRLYSFGYWTVRIFGREHRIGAGGASIVDWGA